jgi:hypothetical protein
VAQAVPPELGAALSELAELLLSTGSFEQLLQGVAELSVRVIKPAPTCGITLAQDGRVITWPWRMRWPVNSTSSNTNTNPDHACSPCPVAKWWRRPTSLRTSVGMAIRPWR